MKRYEALLCPASMEASGYLTEEPNGDWVRYCDVQRLEQYMDAVCSIADQREQGYAARKHGGTVNGDVADQLVSLVQAFRSGLSAAKRTGKENRVLHAARDLKFNGGMVNGHRVPAIVEAFPLFDAIREMQGGQ